MRLSAARCRGDLAKCLRPRRPAPSAKNVVDERLRAGIRAKRIPLRWKKARQTAILQRGGKAARHTVGADDQRGGVARRKTPGADVNPVIGGTILGQVNQGLGG